MFERLRYLTEVARAVRNWPNVLLLYAGLKQNIDVVFRNGIIVRAADKSRLRMILYRLTKVSLHTRALNARVIRQSDSTYTVALGNSEVPLSLDDENSLLRAHTYAFLCDKLNMKFSSEDSCEFNFKGRKVKYFFDPKNLSSLISLVTTFVNGHYKDLDVKKKIVADIGAGFGDTAVYFALKGATQVLAYEPVPWVFKLLEMTVVANGLSQIIKTFPSAVAANPEERTIAIPRNATNVASFCYEPQSQEIVRLSVQTVTPPLEANVVKMNCVGCEDDVILHWLKNKIYDQILILYYGDYVPLVKKLNALGYKSRVSQDKRLILAWA